MQWNVSELRYHCMNHHPHLLWEHCIALSIHVILLFRFQHEKSVQSLRHCYSVTVAPLTKCQRTNVYGFLTVAVWVYVSSNCVVFFFWDSFVRFKDIPWILNFMLCFTTVDFRECEQSFSQKLKIISFCLLKIVISFAQFLSPFYKAAEISYVLWRSVQNTFKETVKGLEPWLSG